MNSSAVNTIIVLVIFVMNCGLVNSVPRRNFSTHFLAHIPHKHTQRVSNRSAWVDAAGGL